MTNQEIIIQEILINNIYTAEEVAAFFEAGVVPPVHTFQTWKSLGYKVKKGEHAKITTSLWKHTKKAKKEDIETGEEEVDAGRFYLAKAFLFTKDQVEKIEEQDNDRQ